MWICPDCPGANRYRHGFPSILKSNSVLILIIFAQNKPFNPIYLFPSKKYRIYLLTKKNIAISFQSQKAQEHLSVQMTFF